MTIDFWYSWNFVSIKDIIKICNLIVRFSKFTLNIKIYDEFVKSLFYGQSFHIKSNNLTKMFEQHIRHADEKNIKTNFNYGIIPRILYWVQYFWMIEIKRKKNVKILISIFKYKKRRRDNLKG